MAYSLSGNPIFDPICNNIARSVGDEICIGLPGTPYEAPTTTFDPVTSFTTPAPTPTDIANGTTTKCGQYYQAVLGDYCNLLVLKFSISVEDFVFLNPQINAK